MLNLNIKIFYLINSYAGSDQTLDMLAVLVTNFLSYIVCAVAVFYVVIYYPLKTEKIITKAKALVQSLEIFSSIILTWLVVKAIKLLVHNPRPFEVLQNTHQLVRESLGQSFPSNHTALAFAVATTVYFHHKKVGKLLFVFATLVGLSRIYVGVHYPIDVLFGAVFGLAIPIILNKIFSQNVKINTKT